MSRDTPQDALEDYLTTQMVANHGGRGQAMHGGFRGNNSVERDALASGVAEQLSKAFEGDSKAPPREVIWNYLDTELKKFTERDRFAESVGFEGATAMSAGGGGGDTAKLEGFAEKVAGAARLYDDLYKSMTEGLSPGDAMYIESSRGSDIEGYRNPLARKVAAEIVKQFNDPSKLNEAERRQVVAQLRENINGIKKDGSDGKRQEFAKEFGWEENHSSWVRGYQKTNEPDAEKAQRFANAIAAPVKAKVLQRQHEAEAQRVHERQEREQAVRLERERKEQEARELRQNKASLALSAALKAVDSQRVVVEKRERAAALERERKELAAQGVLNASIAEVTKERSGQLMETEAVRRGKMGAGLDAMHANFAEMQKKLLSQHNEELAQMVNL